MSSRTGLNLDQKSQLGKNNTELDPAEASRELEILLKLPLDLGKERALTWIRAGLYLVTPEQVSQAVRLNLDASEVIFKHLHLNNFLVRPLAKRLFQIFWESVSYYLTDARALYGILAANPQIQKTLDTGQGRHWIDECCLNGYVFLYNFVWCGA